MVHRVVDHSEIPQQTTFGCELTIPGTEYHHREQSPYKHRGGRKYIFNRSFLISTICKRGFKIPMNDIFH